jgi:hypothetical protein
MAPQDEETLWCVVEAADISVSQLKQCEPHGWVHYSNEKQTWHTTEGTELGASDPCAASTGGRSGGGGGRGRSKVYLPAPAPPRRFPGTEAPGELA